MLLKSSFRSPFLIAATLISLGAALPRAASTAPVKTTLVAGLTQVNHVLVDDAWVYWTEASTSRTRVRKMAKSGGPVIELASEPTVDTGWARSYVHLQQIGGRLFWSRVNAGFTQRWSLYSIPKEGGAVQLVLPEQVGVRPLYASGWRAAGNELLVSLVAPETLNLPADTRLAAYNPETGAWRPALNGRFLKGVSYILTTDATGAYVRGVDAKKGTEIGRLSLEGEPAYTALFRQKETDKSVADTGAADETHLYYWTRVRQGLRKLPLAGGTSTPVFSGARGVGLIVDQGNLYWDSSKKILTRPTAGKKTAKYFNPVHDMAALGGLAYDADALYVVQKQGNTYSIVRVEK